ncbi:MAG: hypothetical protein ACKVTZ_13010 [Bacteroidia bacterium]
MKKNLPLGLLSLLLVVAFVGCKPDDLPPPSTTTPLLKYKGIHDFFAKNQPEKQNFFIDAVAGGSITGKSGIKLTFSPNSFVQKSFNTPVTGLVKIVLQEVTKNSQMAMANIATVSGVDPLVSGGMIHVSVFSEVNGLEVKLAPGMMYATEFPSVGTPINGMQTFIENENDNANAVTWTNNPNTSANVQPLANSYIMTTDSLHWGNCDAFMGALGINTFTKVTVNVPNSPIPLDSCVCFVNFKGKQTLWPLSLTANNNFFSDHVCAINADVVLIGCDGKKLYGAIKRDVILTDNLTVTATLLPMYENQVQSMLLSLD